LRTRGAVFRVHDVKKKCKCVAGNGSSSKGRNDHQLIISGSEDGAAPWKMPLARPSFGYLWPGTCGAKVLTGLAIFQILTLISHC
jgi:hypothetical protein